MPDQEGRRAVAPVADGQQLAAAMQAALQQSLTYGFGRLQSAEATLVGIWSNQDMHAGAFADLLRAQLEYPGRLASQRLRQFRQLHPDALFGMRKLQRDR